MHVSAFHQPILPFPRTTAHCVLQKLPDGVKPDDYFTKFQMETKASANHITTQNGTLGMYVYIDDDKWKVKLTDKSNKGLWDKFTFARFQPK